MRWLVVLALTAALAVGVTADAATTPNVKLTLVVRAASACDWDMPCDPPIGSYTVVFSRVGVLPVRLRMSGPGTLWTHLRPGLYSAKVRSLRPGVVGRAVQVRVRSSGLSAIRLVAPA